MSTLPREPTPPDAWTTGDLGPRTFTRALLVNSPPVALAEAPAPSASPPRRYVSGSEDAGVHLNRAHVATLPDGTRVELPAGTVLREEQAK